MYITSALLVCESKHNWNDIVLFDSLNNLDKWRNNPNEPIFIQVLADLI